jgi:hypothetical protein
MCNRRAFVVVIGCLSLLFWAPAALARPVAGEQLIVELITFGPGDQVYNYFGHAAIVVRSPYSSRARLYNYGVFSFDREMLIKFLMGRLWFSTEVSAAPRTYAKYVKMNRDIRSQQLNLSAKQRMELWSTLERDIRPENRFYLYHHYLNNCVTRLRDLIDRATQGQLKHALAVPARYNLRQRTHRYAVHHPYVDQILVFLMNDQMERPITRWDELFLPAELERAIDRFEYRNEAGERVPLVSRRAVIYRAQNRTPAPQTPPVMWPWTAALGLALAALGALLGLWWLRKTSALARVCLGSYHVVVALLFGLPGLLLALMAVFTEHSVTFYNENLWLANPLTFLLLPLGVILMFNSQWAPRALAWTWIVLATMTLIELGFKCLPAFNQSNETILTLIAPVNLALAALFWSHHSRPGRFGRRRIDQH